MTTLHAVLESRIGSTLLAFMLGAALTLALNWFASDRNASERLVRVETKVVSIAADVEAIKQHLLQRERWTATSYRPPTTPPSEEDR
jgi:hypothetical protein